MAPVAGVAKRTTPTRKGGTYEQFLASLELVAISLESVTCDLKRGKYVAARDKKGDGVSHAIRAQYRVFAARKDHFDGLGQFGLRLQNRKTSEDLLTLDCVFRAHLHSDKMTEAHVGRFVESELRLVLWPYFRQLAADLSARMSIRSLTVPLSPGVGVATERTTPSKRVLSSSQKVGRTD